MLDSRKSFVMPCQSMARAACGLLLVLYAATALAAEPSRLTEGAGNDTEAAWSPDGKQVVFQSDRGRRLGLYVLDLPSGATRSLEVGPGQASFPAWSPDGKSIVYCYAHFTKTALEGQDDGYNLFVVPTAGGQAHRLTAGRYHDYCPTFPPDGKSVWFASDRNEKPRDNTVSLYTVPASGGEPTTIVRREGVDRAAVQATFAPDGRVVAFALVNGFRDNWTLRLARVDRPEAGCPLTDARGAFYAARWSPTGDTVACTGFQVGDAGWGVYLIDPKTGKRSRLETGLGNSRSPTWSPDGREVIFENNRSGQYKLYRMPVPAIGTARPAPAKSSLRNGDGIVLDYRFDRDPVSVVADRSPRKNDGQVTGNPHCRNGGVTFSAGSHIAAIRPRGLDFGAEPFAVQVVVQAPAKAGFAMMAMGEYPGNRLGWQLFLSDDGRAHFNSRDAELKYRGARSDQPLPSNCPVTLLGVRDREGVVRLYVDGALQSQTSDEARHAYGEPLQVRVGSQYNGTAVFPGTIYAVTVFRREVSREEVQGAALEQFWNSLGGKK